MASMRQRKCSCTRHQSNGVVKVMKSQVTKRQMRQLLRKIARIVLVIPRVRRRHTRLYVLDGRKPIRATDVRKWASFLETRNRIVSQTDVGDKFVSTVFLGLNHNYSSSGPPLLFETMVFASAGSDAEWPMYRYPTWTAALAGHQALVADLKQTTGLLASLTTPPSDAEI